MKILSNFTEFRKRFRLKNLHTAPFSLILFWGILFFGFSDSTVYGQFCGTTIEQTPDIDPVSWQAFRNRWLYRRGMEKVRAGITVHIVEQVAGASNIDLDRLYAELDAVNSIYTSAGIEFYFCGSPRAIQGRSIYTYSEAAELLNRSYHIPNTINIFYLDEIGSHELNSFACGISTFPFNSTPEHRFIIMQKGCSTNGTTLAHEIGHFFGLLHTHETALGQELVDGSNCESAGDLICDTPADPNLAFTGLNGCSYQAPYTDRNGDLYQPDPANIMSYAPATCRRRFTVDQAMMMNYWYNAELSYLVSACDFYPDYAMSTGDYNITAGSGQDLDLALDFWKAGLTIGQKVAIDFILKSPSDVLPLTISRDSVLFDGDIQQFSRNFTVRIPLSISAGEYTLTILLDPRNAILERDKRNNILDLNIRIDNSYLADMTIFPNPATDYLRVFLRDRQLSGQVQISISDLYGRPYNSIRSFKSKEELFVELDLGDLHDGTYILTVTFEKIDRTESFLFIKG